MNQKKKSKTAQPDRQTLEERERADRIKETLQVVAQPHRRGNDSDMADPLGVFVRVYQCGRECYDAGNDYFRLVYRWRVANGIPVPLRLSDGETEGVGPRDCETLDQFEKRIRQENQVRLAKIKRCEETMKCSGLSAFRATQNLVLDWIFPETEMVLPVKRALLNLAIEFGKSPL